MTYEETARFLNGALNYWPTLFRGNDPEAMTQAWAVALAEIPYAACARGVVKLAQTMKFPPSTSSTTLSRPSTVSTAFCSKIRSSSTSCTWIPKAKCC